MNGLTTRCTLQKTLEMGPLKSEAQGLDLSINIVYSKLSGFFIQLQACFLAINPPIFGDFASWI